MTSSLNEIADKYRHGEDRPLAGYLQALGVYSGVVGGLTALAWRKGARLPKSISASDFALLSVATHKITRIVSKDAITSPIRAPFTQYKEPAGDGEVNEEIVAKSSAGHTAGELLSCPFCLAVWTSTALFAGLVMAPRQARAVTTVFSATAVSDALQFAYSGLKKLE